MQKPRPTVIIDPELKRVVKSFDLNIATYTQYLYDKGLTPDNVKSIEISFTATGRFLSGGVYNFKTHKMQISVPRARNVNRLLVHETHHALEGMIGRISRVDVVVNRVFNIGVYAGAAVLMLTIAFYLLNDALRISQLNSVLYLTFWLGVALFLTGGMAYIVNPAERRAYGAQPPSVPFVQVVKRPFLQQLICLGQILIARALRRK